MSRMPHIAVAEAEDYGYPRPRQHHIHHGRNGFVASSSSTSRSFSPRLPSPPPDHHYQFDDSAGHYHSSVNKGSSPTSPHSPQHIPGKKRGRLARLGLISMILFPPISIVLLVMLPFVVIISVVVMYAIVWLLYVNMAEPKSIADLPLDPRRIWKLVWIAFSSVWGDLQLLPLGISLIRYRYLNTARPGLCGTLLTDIQYNPHRPDNKLDVHIPIEKIESSSTTSRPTDRHDIHANGGKTAQYRNSSTTQQYVNTSKHLRPTVVFIYGGAWSSGSKWMYTLMGARLSQMGYVAVIPDYSIYPKGKVLEMEQDVKLAIQWAYRNCREFGGDPNRLYVMGHSAGGHLVALTVIKDALQRLPASLMNDCLAESSMLRRIVAERKSSWSRKNGMNGSAGAGGPGGELDILPRLRGMLLCSAPFDIEKHYEHESMRGVEQVSAMGRVMGQSLETFHRHSPTCILQELLRASTANATTTSSVADQQTRHQHLLRQLRNLMPIETLLIHGDHDKTVPLRSTREFFMELKTIQLGSSVQLKVIEGMGHIEPVLALMPSFAVNDPYTAPLMREISHFVDGGDRAGWA